MNNFDLGAEIFIVPALWGILLLTVTVMVKSAVARIRETEGEYEVTRWSVDKPKLKRAGVTLLAGALVLASIVVVPPGHRGAVYTTSGVDLNERQEGYSLMAPIIHNASMVNVREQVYENEEVYAQTSDLLEVTMQIGVNYLITPTMAADIFRDVGQDYEAALIKPAVLDIAKRQAGLVEAVDFPRNRAQIAAAIKADLEERLAPVGITVTFVAIEDAIFAKAFVEQVLAKEVAKEKVIEQERLAEAAVHEADRVERLAEGNANEIRLLAEAQQEQQQLLGLSGREYVWFTQWDGVVPQTLLGSGGEFIVNLP